MPEATLTSKSDAEPAQADCPHATPKPKRQFLRRGEGVHRRVYFAKYKEEARIAREERKIASTHLAAKDLANFSSDNNTSRLEAQGKSSPQEYCSANPQVEDPEQVVWPRKHKGETPCKAQEEEELAGESVLLTFGQDPSQTLRESPANWDISQGNELQQRNSHALSKDQDGFGLIESRLHPFKAVSQTSGGMEGLVGFLNSCREGSFSGVPRWEKKKVLYLNVGQDA